MMQPNKTKRGEIHQFKNKCGRIQFVYHSVKSNQLKAMDEEADHTNTNCNNMDDKDKAKEEEPVVGPLNRDKKQKPSKGVGNDELHERDLEGLTKKSKKEWKDYAKSQMPMPETSADSPLRKSMEDLRIEKPDDEGKPGSSGTSVMAGNSNCKVNHYNPSKNVRYRKKGKKLTNTKGESKRANDTEAMGRIEDPIGPIDLPPNANEHEENNIGQEENESNNAKYVACAFCDKRY